MALIVKNNTPLVTWQCDKAEFHTDPAHNQKRQRSTWNSIRISSIIPHSCRKERWKSNQPHRGRRMGSMLGSGLALWQIRRKYATRHRGRGQVEALDADFEDSKEHYPTSAGDIPHGKLSLPHVEQPAISFSFMVPKSATRKTS